MSRKRGVLLVDDQRSIRDLIKAIMAHNPKAFVIMLTSQNTLMTVPACLSMGRNFSLKDSTSAEIKPRLKVAWVNYARMRCPVA
ncbi:MAG: hypothetical protein R8K48_00415 [Gallionella sp.]